MKHKALKLICLKELCLLDFAALLLIILLGARSEAKAL